MMSNRISGDFKTDLMEGLSGMRNQNKKSIILWLMLLLCYTTLVLLCYSGTTLVLVCNLWRNHSEQYMFAPPPLYSEDDHVTKFNRTHTSSVITFTLSLLYILPHTTINNYYQNYTTSHGRRRIENRTLALAQLNPSTRLLQG